MFIKLIKRIKVQTTNTQVAEYYPIGSTYSPLSPAGTNKYLYNGKEKQDDVLSSTALDEYDYGRRYYDPQIGRFHTLDFDAEKYRRWSPYAYGIDNPVRYEDIDGDGPLDRIKAARLLVKYAAAHGVTYLRQEGDRYRAGYTTEAMNYMDCSEFVARVMAADLITKGVKNLGGTSRLKSILSGSKFIMSQTPHEGDIVLWEKHAGIVSVVDGEKIGVLHAASTNSGILEQKPILSGDFGDTGNLIGYFHPRKEYESPDNKDVSITIDTPEPDQQATSSTSSDSDESLQSSAYTTGNSNDNGNVANKGTETQDSPNRGRKKPGDVGYEGSYDQTYDDTKNK